MALHRATLRHVAPACNTKYHNAPHSATLHHMRHNAPVHKQYVEHYIKFDKTSKKDITDKHRWVPPPPSPRNQHCNNLWRLS